MFPEHEPEYLKVHAVPRGLTIIRHSEINKICAWVNKHWLATRGSA